jgi:hypothetical protein
MAFTSEDVSVLPKKFGGGPHGLGNISFVTVSPVLSPGRGWDFSFRHRVWTGSGAPPSLLSILYRGFFPEAEAAGV